MRAVVQRVKKASVSINGSIVSQISTGMLILLGISPEDTAQDTEYIVKKCANLRIFDDAQGVMNLSALDIGAEILLVSQFTIMGDARKGRRPSYIGAAAPADAVSIYDEAVKCFENTGLTVKTGVFGAEMEVSLVNDGPVTLLLDSTKIF